MRAHHVMTRDVITVTPHTKIEDAANIMLSTTDQTQVAAYTQKVEQVPGVVDVRPIAQTKEQAGPRRGRLVHAVPLLLLRVGEQNLSRPTRIK